MQVKSKRDFSKSYGHLILRWGGMLMVEFLDAGGVQERFFIIIWSFGFKVKWYVDG